MNLAPPQDQQPVDDMAYVPRFPLDPEPNVRDKVEEWRVREAQRGFPTQVMPQDGRTKYYTTNQPVRNNGQTIPVPTSHEYHHVSYFPPSQTTRFLHPNLPRLVPQQGMVHPTIPQADPIVINDVQYFGPPQLIHHVPPHLVQQLGYRVGFTNHGGNPPGYFGRGNPMPPHPQQYPQGGPQGGPQYNQQQQYQHQQQQHHHYTQQNFSYLEHPIIGDHFIDQQRIHHDQTKRKVNFQQLQKHHELNRQFNQRNGQQRTFSERGGIESLDDKHRQKFKEKEERVVQCKFHIMQQQHHIAEQQNVNLSQPPVQQVRTDQPSTSASTSTSAPAPAPTTVQPVEFAAPSAAPSGSPAGRIFQSPDPSSLQQVRGSPAKSSTASSKKEEPPKKRQRMQKPPPLKIATPGEGEGAAEEPESSPAEQVRAPPKFSPVFSPISGGVAPESLPAGPVDSVVALAMSLFAPDPQSPIDLDAPKVVKTEVPSSPYRPPVVQPSVKPATTARPEGRFCNYQPVSELRGHDKSVSVVKFSPCGNYLATASADRSIKLWLTDNWECYKNLANIHSLGINDISWSSDSMYIASVSDDTTVKITAVQTSECIRTLKGHTSYAFCCDFNPQGNLIASGGFDETIILWEATSGRLLTTMPAHTEPVTAVSFNATGTHIVSSSYDGSIRLWDAITGKCLKTLNHQDHAPVSFACFCPNGNYVLAGSLDGFLRLWDYNNGKAVKEYSGHENTKMCLVASFATVGQGKHIVCGSEDGKVYIWDINSKQIDKILESHKTEVIASDCHPTRKFLATAGLEPDNVIRVWRCD